MAFERAWNVVKDVDFRIPRPADPVPSFLDPDANLAFRGSKIPHSWNWDNPYGRNPAINPVTGKEWENPVIDPVTGEKWPNRDDFWESVAWEAAFRAAREGRKAPTEIKVGDDVQWSGDGDFVLPPPYMDYEVGDFGDALEDFKTANHFISRHHGDQQVLDELERASLVRALNDAGIVGRKEMTDAIEEAWFADARGTRSPKQVQVSGPPLFPEQTYRIGPEGIIEYAQDQRERARLEREHEAKYPEPQRRGWLTTQLGGPEEDEY